MIAAGRMSKCLRISASISSSGIMPVPKVSTASEVGCANANRVGDLKLEARRQPRRDDVLGDIARHVCRAAVDLGRVFAGERAAAMPRDTAVGIDDDLAPGQPGVAERTTGDKAPGRVDEDARVARPAVPPGRPD